MWRSGDSFEVFLAILLRVLRPQSCSPLFRQYWWSSFLSLRWSHMSITASRLFVQRRAEANNKWKNQGPALLALVLELHWSSWIPRLPVDSPHSGPVMGKVCLCHGVFMVVLRIDQFIIYMGESAHELMSNILCFWLKFTHQLIIYIGKHTLMMNILHYWYQVISELLA